MGFPSLEIVSFSFQTTRKFFHDKVFGKLVNPPQRQPVPNNQQLNTTTRLKQLLSLPFIHKFYFKYFHYKIFQPYVIASNKQYNITLCFCKFL